MAGRPTDCRGASSRSVCSSIPCGGGSAVADIVVSQWLQQVQSLNLALREHEHTPLYDIQRWAGAGNGALFDSILVFENYPMAEALQQGPATGLTFSAIRRQEQTNYPLTLVAVTGRELSLGVSYDQASFAATTVVALSAQLESLLAQFLADATQPLGTLQLLAEPERQYAIDWGRADVKALDSRSVLEHIAAQVQRQPQADAIVFAEQRIDYQGLDARANRLAHKLQTLGVGPEVRVGVCMRRTPDMLVALLAVLRPVRLCAAGPGYPQELCCICSMTAAPRCCSPSRRRRRCCRALSARSVGGRGHAERIPSRSAGESVGAESAYII